MSPRQKLLLPFGGGLDRVTGSAVVDPDAMANLQNVHLVKGRIELRRGLDFKLDIGWGTDIIAIIPIRAQSTSAVIVYDDVSRDVRLYTVDGTFAAPALIATLWTMPAALGNTLPVVLGADLYGYLVLAHAEPQFLYRQATKVYTVAFSSVGDFVADLDRSGSAETIRARGVARHLSYLVMWGYGTGSDEDRPEVLRISLPGLPGATTDWFVPEHFEIVGNRNDPILNVFKLGRELALAKASESHVLRGSDRRSFGVFDLDAEHGVAAPRLGTVVGDRVFLWSLTGPRVTDGGELEDLELPLDLGGPEPDELITAIEAGDGFAMHDVEKGEVLFVFDHWAYVLHLKDKAPRWSYRPYGYELACSGLVFSGLSAITGSVPPPPEWIGRASPTLGAWYAVERSDLSGVFVAVGGEVGTGYLASSPEGINWTDRAIATTSKLWRAVAFGPAIGTGPKGRWVAIAADGVATEQVMYSDDEGATWSKVGAQMPTAQQWNDVVFDAFHNVFVAVHFDGGVAGVATSADGKAWIPRVTTAHAWAAIACRPSDGLLVMVAADAPPQTTRVSTSVDGGVTWVDHIVMDRVFEDVTYSVELALFVAVFALGSKVGSMATSPDGIAWTQHDLPYGYTEDAVAWTSVRWGAERSLLVAAGGDPSNVLNTKLAASSVDAATWAARTGIPGVYWTDIAYSPALRRFVQVGDRGLVAGSIAPHTIATAG